MLRSVLLAALLVGEAAAFLPPAALSPAALPLRAAAPQHASSPRAVHSLKMGLFDSIGKALNEAMTNDETLSPRDNPGFREGYTGPKEVTVVFPQSGAEVVSYGGEALTDAARKAGVKIPFGCNQGTCGTCEVSLTANGATETVRTCEAIVPIPDQPGQEYVIEIPVRNVAQSAAAQEAQ